MANTNDLKKVVEPDLINGFKRLYNCEILRLSPKELKHVFLDMEPDLVGTDREGTTLYVGEITTSGYFGQKERDFHVGAVKKVSEAFAKFFLYLIPENSKEICSRVKKYYPGLQTIEMSCHFIVPKGSRFINALGYRERLFQTGIMKLDELPLSPHIKEIMEEVLQRSKREMLR